MNFSKASSGRVRAMVICMLFAIMVPIFSGCIRTKEPPKKLDRIELVYYRLYDGADVFDPLIQEYQAARKGVTIKYRKFVDPVAYERLIIDELAEGEGPDIFSIPNSWLVKNHKKVVPADPAIISPDVFREVFVSVAEKDLVRFDPVRQMELVYGIPLSVDTLALYYNKNHFEDKIPSRGKPSPTWEGIKEDVFKLTKQDKSFERFKVSGIALGRADNITRGIDVLLLMMMQNKVPFYNANLSQAAFGKNQGAIDALDLFTSFALPANKNYSWNEYIADPNSGEKEIASFARGKVSMVVGYSYMYQQILDNIEALKKKGLSTVDPQVVRVAPIPQMVDPAVSTEKRDAFAFYNAEVVARTSRHPAEAWNFLNYLASKKAIEHYGQKTKKPTSRRDMIEEQKQDPVYGVFVEQIGYAESLPIYDYAYYRSVFAEAIDGVLATKKVKDVLQVAASKISEILPKEGLVTGPTGE